MIGLIIGILIASVVFGISVMTTLASLAYISYDSSHEKNEPEIPYLLFWFGLTLVSLMLDAIFVYQAVTLVKG